MSLHEKLGFENNPFSKTNADEEPHLSRYFVAPPFFDAVVGDSKNPTASVILAPRGGGKTAQRRMVEEASIARKYLAVTYDRFEFGASDRLSDITLQFHLRNIIIRTLVCYLSYLADYPDLLRGLERVEKQHVSIFAQSYLGNLTGSELQELLRELKSVPERIKEFWHKHVGVLESVVNVLLRSHGLPKVDLPDLPSEHRRLEATYKFQLEYLFSLIRRLGFDSIYVLIDKADETEHTGNNPESTYRLIQPMIKDLELLGLGGFGFKFFLWDQVDEYFEKDARPDRIQQYRLRWTREGLESVLSARLNAFSNGSVTTLHSLIADPVAFSADRAVALLANGSPRNLIRICEKIFAAQANLDANANRICWMALEQGCLSYCEEVATQTYGSDVTRDLQRVGRELFTVNYLANDVFKFSQNAVRNKITGWQDIGVIAQNGTVTVETSKRPLNLYAVVDPAVVRLIHRTVPISELFGSRWRPCKNCSTDNLFDAALFPSGNEPRCRACGRELP